VKERRAGDDVGAVIANVQSEEGNLAYLTGNRGHVPDGMIAANVAEDAKESADLISLSVGVRDRLVALDRSVPDAK